jgi:cob(I)alamin adenosyltransferase
MPSFFTRTGDDGYTGLLGEGRVPKNDPRPETLGTLDEATASLGLARAFSGDADIQNLLLQIQRHLYELMGETAATPENVAAFHKIDSAHVAWLEQQIETMSQGVEIPREFIVPGDTRASAALDLARTVIRRAERRMADLIHRGDVANLDLLRYLNRLSTLVFVLELRDIQAAGNSGPTMAKSG